MNQVSEDVIKNTEDLVKNTVLAIHSSLMLPKSAGGTPIQPKIGGFLKVNWFVGLGSAPSNKFRSAQGTGGKDPKGQVEAENIPMILKYTLGDDPVFIFNNVEYGRFVNDGTSGARGQRGQFFVERAIQRGEVAAGKGSILIERIKVNTFRRVGRRV